MKKRSLIFFCIAVVFSSWTSVHEQGKPVVFALNAQSLEKNKKRVAAKDPSIMAAYKALIKDADKALQFGPVSVMEKKNDPPSGDKHDYMSLAPYYWPDPSKPLRVVL